MDWAEEAMDVIHEALPEFHQGLLQGKFGLMFSDMLEAADQQKMPPEQFAELLKQQQIMTSQEVSLRDQVNHFTPAWNGDRRAAFAFCMVYDIHYVMLVLATTKVAQAKFDPKDLSPEAVQKRAKLATAVGAMENNLVDTLVELGGLNRVQARGCVKAFTTVVGETIDQCRGIGTQR